MLGAGQVSASVVTLVTMKLGLFAEVELVVLELAAAVLLSLPVVFVPLLLEFGRICVPCTFT